MRFQDSDLRCLAENYDWITFTSAPVAGWGANPLTVDLPRFCVPKSHQASEDEQGSEDHQSPRGDPQQIVGGE